jgi:hypothetical protein
MRFDLTILLTLTAIASYGAVPATVSPVPAVKTEVKSRPDPAAIENKAYLQFRQEAIDLLDAVYRKKPELFGELKLRKQREKMLQRIVSGAVPDIQYYGRFSTVPTETRGKSEKKADITVYKALKIPGSGVYYCRIDTLEPANADIVPAAGSGPVIIDLRNCSGGNWQTAEKLLRKIAKNSVLLVGPETVGPAEAVAASVVKAGGITMGGGTVGKPFPETRITLKDGTLLILPERPQAFAKVPKAAAMPVVPEEPVPQVDYKQFSNQANRDRDKCLSRAAELIKVMDLMKNNVKKTK